MKKILLGFILFVYSSGFSQLSDLDFSMSFVTNPTFTAGLDVVDQQGDIFQVKISANDLNAIGELTVMIYDSKSNTPVTVKRLRGQEILTGMYTQNGLIIFNFPYLDQTATYRVIIEAQNLQQAYLPRIEKNFPSN